MPGGTKAKKSTARRSKRSKATIPEGEEGENLAPDVRQAKVDVFHCDFLREMEKRVTSMQTWIESQSQKIKTHSTVKMFQIPKRVREMRVEEFLERGGQFEMVTIDKKDDELEEEPPTKAPRVMKSAIKQTKAAASNLHVQMADEVDELADSVSELPLRPSRLSKMKQTPAQRTSRLGLQTPLVTPKFDPRLPITPANARPARAGDKLMTLRGSPVFVPGEDCPATAVKVQVGRNRAIMIDYTKPMSKNYLSTFEKTDLDTIKKLHDHCSKILSKRK